MLKLFDEAIVKAKSFEEV